MFDWRSLALPYLRLRDCRNSCLTMNVTSVALISVDDDGFWAMRCLVLDADRCRDVIAEFLSLDFFF